MKIAFDISPLKTGHFKQHQVRGSGFYVKHLQDALTSFEKEHEFQFITDESKEEIHADVIHYPYFEPFFLTLPLKHPTKSVVTVHDLTPLLFPRAFPSGLKGKLRWIVQKRALKKVDHIITDSHASKRDIMRIVGVNEEKVSVIYLAASEEYKKISIAEKERSNIMRKYDLPEIFVLFVGDATWNKNLPRIIAASQKADVPIVLVGKALSQENVDSSNPWNKDLVAVQKVAKDNPNIHLLGFVPTDDLVKIYTMSKALVFPSLYEGFGLPILEAMNTGCPVITSQEGSLKEVAGDAAYFCDPYDVDSITNAITTVISSDQLQKSLSSKGLTHAKSFSWKKATYETIAVYKKVR